MKRISSFALIVLVLFATATAGDSPSLRFDHLWIMVSSKAPERAALERAGFKIVGDVNCHDGQGTASITVEFHSTFLELLWRDPTVPVAPGLEQAAEKFQQRGLWRTSGWYPFGIGVRALLKNQPPCHFQHGPQVLRGCRPVQRGKCSLPAMTPRARRFSLFPERWRTSLSRLREGHNISIRLASTI